MKAFKLFLLAICLTLPFGDAFAADNTNNTLLIKVPVPKRNEVKLENSVVQIGQRDFAITFAETYTDVTIELYKEFYCLIGVVEAPVVYAGETIIIHADEDGAIEVTVYSGEEEVWDADI